MFRTKFYIRISLKATKKKKNWGQHIAHPCPRVNSSTYLQTTVPTCSSLLHKCTELLW